MVMPSKLWNSSGAKKNGVRVHVPKYSRVKEVADKGTNLFRPRRRSTRNKWQVKYSKEDTNKKDCDKSVQMLTLGTRELFAKLVCHRLWPLLAEQSPKTCSKTELQVWLQIDPHRSAKYQPQCKEEKMRYNTRIQRKRPLKEKKARIILWETRIHEDRW